jgi:hypothetical protein
VGRGGRLSWGGGGGGGGGGVFLAPPPPPPPAHSGESGNTDAGKTAVVTAYVHGVYTANLASTVGAAFFTKRMYVVGRSDPPRGARGLTRRLAAYA